MSEDVPDVEDGIGTNAVDGPDRECSKVFRNAVKTQGFAFSFYVFQMVYSEQ